MSNDRRKEVVRHLADEELNRLLSEADDPKVVRRLVFIKNLYKGTRSRKLLTASGRQKEQPHAGYVAGTKVASAN